MRRRPWALVVLAALHFLAPLGNIIFNGIISDESVLNYMVMAMSPQYIMNNWVIIVTPIFAGISIYMCKRWSFYVYLVAISILFFFSYVGYSNKIDTMSLLPLLTVYMINVAVVMYFLLPAVRNVYFNRRLRWWEIQTRYRCQFKCVWKTKGENTQHTGQVGNISANGLFLKSDELPSDHSDVEVFFTSGVLGDVEFMGEVILHNKVDALGFGVQFDHTPESKKQVKRLIVDLEKKGMKISTLDGRAEDSFTYWLHKLLTTGRGLFPKKEK